MQGERRTTDDEKRQIAKFVMNSQAMTLGRVSHTMAIVAQAAPTRVARSIPYAAHDQADGRWTAVTSRQTTTKREPDPLRRTLCALGNVMLLVRSLGTTISIVYYLSVGERAIPLSDYSDMRLCVRFCLTTFWAWSDREGRVIA